MSQEAGVKAGPLQHGILGGRWAAAPGDAEGAVGPGLQWDETVGAREESKSEGSNNFINNSSSGGSGDVNKGDRKIEGNSNNNSSGCANSSMCEGEGGP